MGFGLGDLADVAGGFARGSRNMLKMQAQNKALKLDERRVDLAEDRYDKMHVEALNKTLIEAYDAKSQLFESIKGANLGAGPPALSKDATKTMAALDAQIARIEGLLGEKSAYEDGKGAEAAANTAKVDKEIRTQLIKELGKSDPMALTGHFGMGQNLPPQGTPSQKPQDAPGATQPATGPEPRAYAPAQPPQERVVPGGKVIDLTTKEPWTTTVNYDNEGAARVGAAAWKRAYDAGDVEGYPRITVNGNVLDGELEAARVAEAQIVISTAADKTAAIKASSRTTQSQSRVAEATEPLQIENAQLDVDRSKLALEQAEWDFKRSKELGPVDKKRAETALASAKSQLEESKARLEEFKSSAESRKRAQDANVRSAETGAVIGEETREDVIEQEKQATERGAIQLETDKATQSAVTQQILDGSTMTGLKLKLLESTLMNELESSDLSLLAENEDFRRSLELGKEAIKKAKLEGLISEKEAAVADQRIDNALKLGDLQVEGQTLAVGEAAAASQARKAREKAGGQLVSDVNALMDDIPENDPMSPYLRRLYEGGAITTTRTGETLILAGTKGSAEAIQKILDPLHESGKHQGVSVQYVGDYAVEQASVAQVRREHQKALDKQNRESTILASRDINLYFAKQSGLGGNVRVKPNAYAEYDPEDPESFTVFDGLQNIFGLSGDNDMFTADTPQDADDGSDFLSQMDAFEDNLAETETVEGDVNVDGIMGQAYTDIWGAYAGTINVYATKRSDMPRVNNSSRKGPTGKEQIIFSPLDNLVTEDHVQNAKAIMQKMGQYNKMVDYDVEMNPNVAEIVASLPALIERDDRIDVPGVDSAAPRTYTAGFRGAHFEEAILDAVVEEDLAQLMEAKEMLVDIRYTLTERKPTNPELMGMYRAITSPFTTRSTYEPKSQRQGTDTFSNIDHGLRQIDAGIKAIGAERSRHGNEAYSRSSHHISR